MNKSLKQALFALIPSSILGLGFFFLISVLNGMEEIENTSPTWILIGIFIFIYIFVLKNSGQNIFGRFLKYAAYECWLSPLCILIYTINSISQANNSIGGAGAVGAGFSGILLIFTFGLVGGLLGVVLYLIGNSVIKNNITKN